MGSTVTGIEKTVGKAQSLSSKMDKITAKFSENLDVADELVMGGEDIIVTVESQTTEIAECVEAGIVEEITTAEIINLKNMVSDFTFVRETLKENTENARKVLNCVTLDLIGSDDEKRASLIMSFAELNKAVADNMKLYITAYKEISTVLLNLEKIKGAAGPTTVNNTIIAGEALSTADIIKGLGDSNA